MNRSRLTTLLTDPFLAALLLAIAAGSTTTVLAQPGDKPMWQASPTASVTDFRSSKWLISRDVVNGNGDTIATVSDLLLDRGSGRIQYVIVKTGTTFGLGGRAVAIPYASFGTETSGKDRFMLNVTAEQIAQFPEFTPEVWKTMRESGQYDKSTLRRRLAADNATPVDPYAGSITGAQTARTEGMVTQVSHVNSGAFGEQLEVDVKVADGSIKRIAMGPTWYVNGSPAAPMRGDTVAIDTLTLPRNPDQMVVATHLLNGSRKLRLREEGGRPTWALETVESDGRTYNTPYSRYLVMTDLMGMKVDCRGQETGKVNDVILDRNSGQLAFLSIDPNQNFLGIGDTKRLIPWSVAIVALDGTLRIDAAKEMVISSTETPKDISALNTGTQAASVYRAFDVPSPRYDLTPAVAAPATIGSTNHWAKRGPIIRAIVSNSNAMITGEVISVSQVAFQDGAQPAHAVRIHVAGVNGGGSEANSEEVVLLGPAWYLDKQVPMCKTGDAISVQASRSSIDGRPVWIARSVECKGNTVVLVSETETPAWDVP